MSRAIDTSYRFYRDRDGTLARRGYPEPGTQIWAPHLSNWYSYPVDIFHDAAPIDNWLALDEIGGNVEDLTKPTAKD